MRPPGGYLRAGDWAWLVRHQYVPVLWSFDTGDSMISGGKWKHGPVDYSGVGAGDIVLMHDDNRVCVEALDSMFEVMAGKGLRSVAVSRLLRL